MKIARCITAGILLLASALDLPTVLGRPADQPLPEFSARSWAKADGLPQGPISAILHGRDGYLWIGTSAGLMKFDGFAFERLRLTDSGDEEPVVSALCEDQEGKLWIGTSTGLFSFEAGKVQRITRLAREAVTTLCLDAGQRLWVGTAHGAIVREGSELKQFTIRDGLPADAVTALHGARSGAVWITTRGGLCQYAKGRIAGVELASPGRNPEFLGAYEDRQGNLWAFGATYLINLTEGKRFNYFNADEPRSVRIWSLCEGRDGRFWIGTSGRGLFWFDGNRFQPAELSDEEWSNDVRAICEDREGNLWLGLSSGGLVRLRPRTVSTVGAKQGLPAGGIAALTLDPQGMLVAASDSGQLFASHAERFAPLPSGLANQELLSCLCFAPDGTLWLGTAGAGLYALKGGRAARYSTAQGLWDNEVLALCAEGLDTVWVATAGGLHRIRNGKLSQLGNQNGWPGMPATALLPRKNGGIWIGTSQGTLFRAEGEHIESLNRRDPLGTAILSLSEEVPGVLWIGTAAGQVGHLRGRTLKMFEPGVGLPSGPVRGLATDPEGDLWFLNNRGVYRLSSGSLAKALAEQMPPHALLVHSFQSAGSIRPGGPRALVEGMRPRAVAVASDARAATDPPVADPKPERRLWFATPQGLVTVNPVQWPTEPTPPPVRLERVLVRSRNSEQMLPLRQPASASNERLVRLPASFQALELQFTAINLGAPETVVFRHKLEGFDADWIESGTERRVRYGRLSPGQYRFMVTARSGDEPWNEQGAEFAFVVPTPLWRTPYAIGAYVIGATALVFGVARLVSHRRLRRKLARLQQQQVMERERVRIAKDMHDEIGSKLTKISFLSERAKADLRGTGAVAGKIDSIANTSRELLLALDEIVWAVNPRNDTLEHLADYLAQYAAEYFQNTAVECDLRLPDRLPALSMSAETRHNLFLAFEEALNNVLKHSGATKVSVQIQTEDGELRIVVSDNGKGVTPSLADGQPVESTVTRQSTVLNNGLASRVNSLSPAEQAKAPLGLGGNGLPNMRQRLDDIGGRFQIAANTAQGTTVTLTIPLRDRLLNT